MQNRRLLPSPPFALAVTLALAAACGSGANSDGTGGAAPTGGTKAGSTGGSTGGANTGGRADTGGDSGTATGGTPSTSTGGTPSTSTGGAVATGGARTGGATGNGGRPAGGAGQPAGGAGAATGGAGTATGGAGPDGGAGSCVGKAWGTADPAAAGPFKVVKETNVGPMAGQPDPKYNNAVQRFYIYRPMDMATSGYCHPVVMWSNGHGDQPSTYEVLLNNLASHGFVVMASLSSIPSQGTPVPVVTGAAWIAAQNEDASSEFYHHLDTSHIGASGHSEGGLATCMASSDSHITAIATVSGSAANAGLHGPALLFCGGKDTVVPCSNVMTTFSSIKNQPAMLADNLASDHGSWLYQSGVKGPDIFGITAWMRVHLMGDTANRKYFYGPSCTFCADSRFQVTRNTFLDQP